MNQGDKPTQTVGVRESSDTQAPEMSLDSLRQEMRQKMTTQSEPKAEIVKKQAVDLSTALSNPKSKAVRYGIIGTGHGGSRLAEQFHQFGYSVCVVNTSEQDLYHIQLPEANKLFMDYALGGAGKDMDVGAAATQESEEKIKALVDKVFGEDAKSIDALVVCIGGGGGTGTGSAIPLISILSDYQLPITVLYTLPMQSEGTVTKSNAIEGLNKLAQLTVNKLLNGLIIIDNSRIEDLYSDVSLGGFFKVANFDIANIFNSFNTMSSLPTQYTAIDPMDYTKIMTSGGCTIYGKIEIPLVVEDGRVEVGEDDVADLLLQNLQNSMLAEGFNVSEALRFGVYITGKSAYLDQIPAGTFNYAFASLNDELKKADLFKGVYADERLGDSLVVYLLVSGVGLPRERVQQLIEQAQSDVEEMNEKEHNVRAKMEVFQQTNTNKEQDRYRQKKKDGSTFNRMINRRRDR